MSQRTTAIVGQCAPADPGADRRSSFRHLSGVQGCCQTLSVRRETSWQATVRDICPDGIGLLLARRFEPGALLTIEITENTGGRKRLLLGRVAHATAWPEGGWLIGCTLLSPLTDDDVRALL